MHRTTWALVAASIVAVLWVVPDAVGSAKEPVAKAVIYAIPLEQPAGKPVEPTGPLVKPGPAVTTTSHPTGQPPLGATTRYQYWSFDRKGYPWTPYAEDPCTTYLRVPSFVAGTEWVNSGADFTFIRPAQWHVIRQGMGEEGDFYVNLARDRFERPAGLIRVRVIGAPCAVRCPKRLVGATVRDYEAYGFSGEASGVLRTTVGRTPFCVHRYTGDEAGRQAELAVYVGRAGGRWIVVSLLGARVTGNHVLANANRRAVGTILATLTICGTQLACPKTPCGKPCYRPCRKPCVKPCRRAKH